MYRPKGRYEISKIKLVRVVLFKGLRDDMRLVCSTLLGFFFFV